ncbi:hypothetical protein AVEN_225673-1 [Araneus ventricosus]|uniref:Uncharacterized protein n=1 Tax=Araneus ventricosus TaxID=182803 RepID=A0A4Y2NSU7_ARAVE|nr:hypothetical protein AVEN_225673-1 [Araneus ventricosus]
MKKLENTMGIPTEKLGSALPLFKPMEDDISGQSQLLVWLPILVCLQKKGVLVERLAAKHAYVKFVIVLSREQDVIMMASNMAETLEVCMHQEEIDGCHSFPLIGGVAGAEINQRISS